MKAKIIIDGKECEIVLTEEQKTEIEKISKKRVKRWEDLVHVGGFYIASNSYISVVGGMKPDDSNRNSFATENQAKGVLAMAQLSQLMKDVNGNWEADWTNLSLKECIEFRGDRAITNSWQETGQFLAFPTAEIRDQFLKDHKELIETYFLIYQ